MPGGDEAALVRIYEKLEELKRDQAETHEAVMSLDVAIRGDGQEKPGLAAKVRENSKSVKGIRRGLWLAGAALIALVVDGAKRWLWGD